MPKYILNDLPVELTESSEKIAEELKKGINNLKGDFYDLETGNVNYSGMKGSEIFEEYKITSAKLKNFNLDSLKTNEAKLAFWINIYNSLTVHGIIELKIKKSVREISSFFESVCYKIGEYSFTLDEIEHGILRGNKKKYFFSNRVFSKKDERIKFVFDNFDPRIHFCLVCGSKSCPPIATYQENIIDKQMDIATSNFINGVDLILEKNTYVLKISKIFKWYKSDFGSKEELINLIIKYNKNEETKSFLQENKNKIKISYLEYDWNLNH